MLVGDFNVEAPPKSLAWQKGFRLGSGLILKVPWALAAGLQPSSTCLREWGFLVVVLVRDFMIGCPLAAAAVLSR